MPQRDVSGKRLNRASKYIQRFTNTESLHAAFLIGSSAEGTASRDSDLDIALIVNDIEEDEPFHSEINDEGITVSVERYSLLLLELLPDVPMLHLRRLRDLTRLAAGVSLITPWPGWQPILQRLQRSLLHPDDAAEWFAVLAVALQKDQKGDLQNLLLRLQAAAITTANLTLCLPPAKYNKPKWLLRDLHGTGNSRLSSLLSSLFPPFVKSQQDTHTFVNRVQLFLREAYENSALRDFRYTGSDYELDYVYRTFRDADQLVEMGRWADAGLTASISARLMIQYMMANSPPLLVTQFYTQFISLMRVEGELNLLETLDELQLSAVGLHDRYSELYA